MRPNQKLDKILGGGINGLGTAQSAPKISPKRIGIISRDYRESGGFSDFNDCLDEVLKYCDASECDTILFSPFTVLKTNMADLASKFEKLKFIKSLFIEEFTVQDGIRCTGNYHCFYSTNNKWHDYIFFQKFATVLYTKKFENEVIQPFIKEVESKRLLGGVTVLLCGETNAVKYDKEKREIVDHFGLLKAFHSETGIILNPVHDRMTRFEMKLKRAFLSNQSRVVISVWNKGKTDQKGITRDGKNPPWTIYSNGKVINLTREDIGDIGFSNKGLEIGILNVPTS